MPTYAEHAADRERAQRRQTQDRLMARRHRDFDLSARDMHHKHDRPQFAVVGEGSRAAQENYARGYAAIDWSPA